MEFLEVSAKTVDEAITKACIDLGQSSDQLEIQVISEGSTGFLGIGSKPAVIQVRKKEAEAPAEEKKPEAREIPAEPKEEPKKAPAKPQEKKEQKNKILQMAQTDPLTGLANRRYFYEMISESDKSHGMTVCYFDLDNFKELNDTYGHNYGDDALIGVADLFRHAFQNDFITRIGGDEFVASVIGSPNKRLMSVRLDVLMRNAELFFSKKEYTRGLSMSIGVSYSENDSLPIDTLIQQSDAALYHSKHTGKNKYSFYDDIV